MLSRLTSFLLFASLLLLASCAERVDETVAPLTVEVFRDNVIHFTPDDTTRYDTATVWAQDKGRVIRTYLELVRPAWPARITAFLTLEPIPKDIRNVHDRWDRAGHISLVQPDGPDLEMVRFMTSYGGKTEHEVDVTHLAPLLTGTCTFEGFIDTWVSPAWQMDFRLEFTFDRAADRPDWAAGIFLESLTAENTASGPQTVAVEIPAGIRRVQMHYLVSGHCTDGRDEDEFVTKDNVILVDGAEVFRCRPWRDDCRRFRAMNPYCAKWSDGSWSSDYSRSGWCPGDVVLPVKVDLTDALAPGPHVVGFTIEDIRPRDENGHLGYWRVSSHLVGWKD